MVPWKEVSAAISKIFALSTETQKNKADIKQTRDELEKLEQKVQRLNQQVIDLTFAFSVPTLKLSAFGMTTSAGTETRARERENLILRLENQKFRLERSLPPDTGTPEE